MFNYFKRFLVFFLFLFLLQPMYGMQKNNNENVFPKNTLLKAIGIISNVIQAPFAYLYKKLHTATSQEKKIIENFKKYSPIADEAHNKCAHEEAVKFAPLMTIFPYIYMQQKQQNQNEKDATTNNSNNANSIDLYQISLNKYKEQRLLTEKFHNALENARESNFSDKTCNALNSCLEQNIDVNAKDHRGRISLHNMLEILYVNPKKFDEQLFGKLLGNGADANAKDKEGVSPLWVALWTEKKARENKKATSVHKAVLNLLVDSGADVNEKSAGKAPLLWVIDSKNIELIRKFSAAGANLSDINDLGEDAIVVMLKATQNQPLRSKLLGVSTLIVYPKFNETEDARFKEFLLVLQKRGIPPEMSCLLLSYWPECHFSDTQIRGLLGKNFENFSVINQTKNRVKQVNEILQDPEHQNVCAALVPQSINHNEGNELLRSLVLNNDRLNKDFNEFIKNPNPVSSTNLASEVYNNLLLQKKACKSCQKTSKPQNSKFKSLIAEN